MLKENLDNDTRIGHKTHVAMTDVRIITAAVLIPSTNGFKSMKNTENMRFPEDGIVNSFVEMKLRASKKGINT
ncbi:hypothetical protein IGI39_001436 [Enterococcus sp. AZ135]|uniref:hypothetical protein n=2 Tax=Enterococcus TaxID=1350 RepID=UPI003F27981E